MIQKFPNLAYEQWSRIFNQCFSTSFRRNHPEFENYKCCKEWGSFNTFQDWYNDKTRYGKTVKPIDNFYSPETVTIC